MSKQVFSKKVNAQLLTEVLLSYDITDIVISPGSRNGAITMNAVNHPKIKAYSIVDERCAAFVAMGMAKSLQKPVAISCTSGSAATNYYPAITEAFYQNIPLIVITADRPKSHIDISDGQTIRQENIFEKHTYCSVQLLENEENIEENLVLLEQAVSESILNQGPVHINIPFAEPLYESTNNQAIKLEKAKLPKRKDLEINWKELENQWTESKRIMFLVGQQEVSEDLNDLLTKFSKMKQVVILTESTANVYHDKFINKIDNTLDRISENNHSEYSPDLLITLGQNVISKKIKKFLRANKPKYHWHINEFWKSDTYFCLNEYINWNEADFLKELIKKVDSEESNYQSEWLKKMAQKNQLQNDFMKNLPWCDLLVFKEIINKFPNDYIVHFGNSSVIRYAQLFDYPKLNKIYCNRGTSGIDGSTSTAIGYAMKSEKPVVLVSGDISFFYDSNALWNNYIPNNFRIILIKNGGGNIFSIIPGPKETNALDEFFETRHNLSSEHLAKMFGFEFLSVSSKNELIESLENFYNPSECPKILEVDTSNIENSAILHQLLKI